MRIRSISHRIFFWLLVFSVLPLVVMSEIFLSKFEDEVQKSEFKHLNHILDKNFKQTRIYLSERQDDIDKLSRSPFVADFKNDIGKVFNEKGVDTEEYKRVESSFSEYAAVFLENGYYDLFLIAPNGDIEFTVKHESDFATNLNSGPYSTTGLADVYRDTLEKQKTHISTFKFYQPSNEPAAFLATPIMQHGRMQGILALQIDIAKMLAVLSDNVGMSKSGETVIARESGDLIDFIGPLKFKTDTLDHMKLSRLSELAMPMHKALDGEKGYGFSVDYRGEHVIAAWQYLPEMKWGVVVKEDVDEAFSSVRAMRDLRVIVLASLLGVSVVLAYAIGQSITKPIRDLIVASSELASGDLQRRVHVGSSDEVGQLAASFNYMAEELGKTHLELVKEVRAAEKANLAKSEFLSSMSHELRTPLNAILGFAQMLELDINGFNQTQRENVGEILTAGRHLLGLINEVLDLARIESGKLEISMEDVLLSDVFAQSISLVTSQSEMRNITVINMLRDEDYRLYADYTRLKQVMVNLLSNAVKYNREDGAILIDCELVGNGRLRINVKDTGCGLSKEQIGKLFTSFERLNVVENVEGTGIGLVITKHLVELMGGTIGVESVVGEGSVFWVEIALFTE